ncbi:MAG TPA: hypothetical protein VF013_11355, partial [Candidatus Limnocylindria bacterium]
MVENERVFHIEPMARGWYADLPASPAAEYGNRARAGPMRKPADKTARDREDRNATGEAFSFVEQRRDG